MTLRYWLVVVCVALALGTLCDASVGGHNPPRAPTGSMSDQDAWRALEQYPWPVYPRVPHRPASRPLYPRWPLPNSNLRVRWPNARPAAARAPPRVQHTHTHLRDATRRRPHTSRGSQDSSRRSASRLRPVPAASTRSRSLASSLRLSDSHQERRRGKQWILPRRLFMSTGSSQSSTGRTQPQSCTQGKVWQGGACECPYLSNWNAEKNKCECVYGTYRHASGHCMNY